jgi:magnesium transporter
MPLDPEETATAAEGFREGGGGVDADFVFEVEAAIALGDSKRIHELVGDLHEADVGALIEQ